MKDARDGVVLGDRRQIFGTHLQETVGSNEELIGPFRDYEAAKEEWIKHAWHSIDQGTTRYRIVPIDSDAPPPCTDWSPVRSFERPKSARIQADTETGDSR